MKEVKARVITHNIAKSGEVLIWGGFSPFQLHFGLIVNYLQSASCHIANVIFIYSLMLYQKLFSLDLSLL